MPATWKLVLDRTSELYTNALVESTKRQYAAHATYWARLCVLFGFRDRIFDPSEETICVFVGWLSLSNVASSVQTLMSGVKSFVIEHDVTTPWSDWHKYRRVMKGLKRRAGT